MSHYRVKTKFNVEGSYGAIDQDTLYAHHNLSCDYVTFYDSNGNVIMSIPDTLENNMLEAIKRLWMPFKKENNQELEDGVEYMNEEDRNKCR